MKAGMWWEPGGSLVVLSYFRLTTHTQRAGDAQNSSRCFIPEEMPETTTLAVQIFSVSHPRQQPAPGKLFESSSRQQVMTVRVSFLLTLPVSSLLHPEELEGMRIRFVAIDSTNTDMFGSSGRHSLGTRPSPPAKFRRLPPRQRYQST